MATAAGVLFLRHNYDTVMGVTPKHSHYSGFGGTKEEGESILTTALREAVEELYGISPDEELLDELVETLGSNSRSLPRVPATVPRLRACGGSRRRTRHPVTRRHRVITPPRRPYAGALTLPPFFESRPAVPRGHVVAGVTAGWDSREGGMDQGGVIARLTI